jgi:flagellar motor switch protein FliN/FliY
MAAETPGPEGGPPLDEMAQRALDTAREAVQAAQDVRGKAPTPLELPAFSPEGSERPSRAMDLLADVNLHVKIELGRTRMLLEDVLRLGEGAVVELDKLAGDPVDVYVNDRHVARGEVLVLNDNFCVRINEIIAPAEQAPAKSA